MKHLEYRLHELDDGSAANALWDDLGDAHPDLRALFTNLRARLSFADVDELHSRIASMGGEIDARDDEIARLSDDLEYQRDRTQWLEIDLHDEIARLSDDLEYQRDRTQRLEIDLHDEIARLSDDLEYQRDRAQRLEIDLHDATRELQTYKTETGSKP